MTDKHHHYTLEVEWTGNNGIGTENYEVYSRSHLVRAAHKPVIEASSDAAFRGDVEKYNPEEFFVASISSCHMLWYLHLCADNDIVVHAYRDNPEGTLCEPAGAPGHFASVVLKPKVTVAEEWMVEKANSLHEQAHERCFIANSCNFPISIVPECNVGTI
ncbi:MAG: OsmC family protein [Chitinophagaceae bacterium]